MSDENELIGTNHVGDMIVDKHLMTASRAKAMKSGFSYSLPTLGLLSILMLPLAGCDDTDWVNARDGAIPGAGLSYKDA